MGTSLSLLANPSAALAFAAAVACFVLGGAALVQSRRSFASWCFLGGMGVFGAECVCEGLSARSVRPEDLVFWQSLTLLAKSVAPGFWLAFSLSYSRGNYREFLWRWRFVLALVAAAPPLLAAAFFRGLLAVPDDAPAAAQVFWLALSPPAKLLNVLLLVSILLILTNFERTFQASVGTMRWRVKFLLLGLGLVFGARVYTRSLTLLFSGQDLALVDLETGALLVGCALIGVAHLRRGFSGVDVYPSHAMLQNSVTFVLAGAYLFLIGVLGQVVKWLGGSSSFQWQALVILAGVAGLGALLLSDRLRQQTKYFVSRNFRRPHYDFRQVWRGLTERLASAPDAAGACLAATRTISETFSVLAVTVWLLDDQARWLPGASTAEKASSAAPPAAALEAADLADLAGRTEPFNLENASAAWAAPLREAISQQFAAGGRLGAVLRAGGRVLGVAVLGDRVNRLPYTLEEFELLKCLADQLAAALLNFRLGQDLALARELETFQTMSAFFVHDLKNSVSGLNLMLQNLPQHFDNPEFRADALRGLGRTVGHINGLIARLSSFRSQLELNLGPADLDALVAEVIAQLGPRAVAVSASLELKQPVRLDREQMRSVVTNLLVNAHEATPPGGSIAVTTGRRGGQAVLTVTDTGCGMTPEFLRHSLFRPFQTTKQKGTGIGMFQSRMIVEAHRGQIQVRSEAQKGATFQVMLPL